MVIDNHDCSCGSGCSRVGQFHQHAQPNWVDHCSCMPRGSGDLLHRQQADFLNMPRSSARRDSTFQQPGPARPVCFTVIDVLSSRCAAAPLRPAPLRCCAAPPLHPVWISCPRRGISFLWRRTPIGSLPARDFLHRLTDSILAPQELARVRPTPPPPPFLVHSLSDPCAGRSVPAALGLLRPAREFGGSDNVVEARLHGSGGKRQRRLFLGFFDVKPTATGASYQLFYPTIRLSPCVRCGCWLPSFISLLFLVAPEKSHNSLRRHRKEIPRRGDIL